MAPNSLGHAVTGGNSPGVRAWRRLPLAEIIVPTGDGSSGPETVNPVNTWSLYDRAPKPCARVILARGHPQDSLVQVVTRMRCTVRSADSIYCRQLIVARSAALSSVSTDKIATAGHAPSGTLALRAPAWLRAAFGGLRPFDRACPAVQIQKRRECVGTRGAYLSSSPRLRRAWRNGLECIFRVDVYVTIWR